MPELPKLKTAAFRFRMSLLDATVWIVMALLIGSLALLAGVSDPARRGAQVAYLYPTMGDEPQNIWLASVADPSHAVQITQEKSGVYNFDVSPDGRFIVYSARDSLTGLNDLFMLDLRDHHTQILTNCVAENADCRTPAIKPDGNTIAYERMGFIRSKNGVPGGVGAIRIWLLDISKQPYTTRPLVDDAQIVGHSPQWTQDGATLAFFSADIANPGIILYNIIPREGEKAFNFIPANYGMVGSLSPNSRKLVFPDAIDHNGNYSTVLKWADLDAMKFNLLTPENAPVEDTDAVWHPDGQRMAITRRFTDNRRTPGFQIYLYNPQTGDTQQIAYDKDYSHSFMEWNKTGDKLLYERFALNKADAKPEVAVRDMTTGQNTVLALNAFQPEWVQP